MAMTMTTRAAVVLLFASGCVLGGCKKALPPPPADPEAQDVDPKALIDAWQKAGFTVDGFAPIDPSTYAASTCLGGKVSNVDTAVCTYKDDDALKTGEATADKNIGKALSGLAAPRGHTLLVIIDHNRTDPKGADSKTINTLAKTFATL
jgi:hypothetical protein